MKYQNTKTGFVLDTVCEIKGKDWVKLDPSLLIEKSEKAPRKRKTSDNNN